MKKILALTIVLTGAIGLTMAIAGPEHYSAKEAAPIVQPECDWTGWYMGGHVGWGGGQTSWRAAEDLDEVTDEHEFDGIFGGLQLGYNRQVGSWFVLGWELTGAYSGIDGERSVIKDGGEEVDTTSTENRWIGTAGLRAGFLSMNNKCLFYGKFGAAITDWQYDLVHDETVEAGRPEFDRWSEGEVRVSPMAGLGIEYSINCHWSAKLEYQHLFLGDRDVQGTLVEDFETDEGEFGKRIKLSHDSVQIGFNYHF